MPANRRVLAASLCLHPQLSHRITVVPVALVSPRANASACVLISRGANLGNGELRCGATLPIDCKSPTNRHRRFLGYHRATERGGAHGACEVVPTRSLDGVLAQLKSVPDVIDVVKIECATPARTEDLLRSCLPWCHSVQTRARAQPGGKRMQRVGRWAEPVCAISTTSHRCGDANRGGERVRGQDGGTARVQAAPRSGGESKPLYDTVVSLQGPV